MTFGDNQYAFIRLHHGYTIPGLVNRKLSNQCVGPFHIICCVGELAYKLDLPPMMQIHPVISIAQLEPSPNPNNDPYGCDIANNSPPVTKENDDYDAPSYKIKQLLDKQTMFVHASRPNDIMLHHLQGQRTVVLVDSMVNSSKMVVQYVQHICNLHATIRIVVIADVVQTQFVSSLTQALARYTKLSLVALCLSDNKFTGRGTTNTDNCLFNTMHLP